MTAAPHPLTLAVIRHKLQAVAEEMVETMTRTCFSPILNQNQDFSAVVLDAAGQTLAQAERVPIHMGAMPWAIRAMAEAFDGDIAKDDVLMANDPYWGGSHLPDITLALPVFADGALRLWVALRAHQALGCRGASRADLRFDESVDGARRLVLLEVNTQPGLTRTSLLPEQAAHCGIPFPALCAWMVKEARHGA